jgi:hypothetical protein
MSGPIRSALMTAKSMGGQLELKRAEEAKKRAPGQVAPSKYMPGVPRQVRAEGGALDDDGFDVYHSSPHDFDQFDMSRMGTGEGNQMYGHGLYFAEEPAVSGQGGKYYNQFLMKMKPGAEQSAANALLYAKFDKEKAIQNLEKTAAYHLEHATKNYGNGPEYMEGNRLLHDQYSKAIDLIRSGQPVGPRTYETRVNASKDHFWDWDAPIADQHEKVLAAIKPFFPAGIPQTNQYGAPLKGGDIYHQVLDRSGGVMHGRVLDAAEIPDRLPGGTKERLSKYLLKMGVPGIKYLDAGSRVHGSGSRNYVVFDDKLTSVKKKYEFGGIAKSEGGEAEGKPLRLYHGTEVPEPIAQYNPFISPDQLGIHLGDAATANRFAKRMNYDPKTNAMMAPRVAPLDVKIKNPLRLHDSWGTWDPSIVHKQLMDRKLVPVDHDYNDALMAMENGEHPGGKPAKTKREEQQLQRAAMDEIHNIIRGLGYDSVVYLNRYEMPTDDAKERLEKHPLMRGQLNKLSDDEFKQHFPEAVDSYIVFDPDQITSPFGEGPGRGFADGGDVDGNAEGGIDQFYGPTDQNLRRRYYTGTSKDKDFTAFQESRHGTWLTDDPHDASSYAESNDSQSHRLIPGTWNFEPVNTASRVIPAYVRVENPYTGELPDFARVDNYKKAQSDWFDKLRAQGYDAWVPDSRQGGLVVKLTNQGTHIKSAIGNSGAYDLKKKHLAKASGGFAGGENVDKLIKKAMLTARNAGRK